jgi:hypothetical protein
VPAHFLANDFGVAPKSNCNLDEIKDLPTAAKNKSRNIMLEKVTVK